MQTVGGNIFLHSDTSDTLLTTENDITHTLCTSCLYVFLTGQRLFRRSGASSDSLSETSSIGQAEEMSREGSTTLSSSSHPPNSSAAPNKDSLPESGVVPEEILESAEQVHTQVEAEASEERQPEGQEAEQSER